MVYIFMPCWWTIYSSADPFLKSLWVISIFWQHKPSCCEHLCALWDISADCIPRHGEVKVLSVFRPVWFWPHSDLVALFPRGLTRHHGAEGPAQWWWEVPLCGQKLHQQPSGPGWLGCQEAGLGPFGEAGFRGSQHQGGERGWGDRGAGGEWQEGHSRQRWHPEDEPAQVL